MAANAIALNGSEADAPGHGHAESRHIAVGIMDLEKRAGNRSALIKHRLEFPALQQTGRAGMAQPTGHSVTAAEISGYWSRPGACVLSLGER